MSSFKVIIIGAGLAGTTLANGLMRHDINVQVYERLPQDSKREGYQIRLGAHALRGLRACLSQDELQRIVSKFGPANGSKSEAPIVVNRNFENVLDLSKFPSYNKSAPISRVVLRDSLAEPVAAAGKLKYGTKFDKYEILNPNTSKERVRVWFEDGSHDDCDILVAADGSHSKANKQIGLDNITQLDGYVSMIAKNELPTKRFLATNPRIIEKPILAFADNKSLYYCAYLPQSVEQDGKYDESLSSSFFGLHVPSDSCPKDLAKLSSSAQWEYVRQTLQNWGKEFHEIIDLVSDSDLYVYRGRVSADPGKGWRSKVGSDQEPERGHHRVWMVGDSIHAMLPNRGMGGNSALCDCDQALRMLTRLASSASTSGIVDDTAVVQACKEYEDEMMPRAFGWVKASGGASMVPVDASTIKGKTIFALAAIAMQVVGYMYAFAGLFVNRKFVDDAPELR